jgi:hypothetical protein
MLKTSISTRPTLLGTALASLVLVAAISACGSSPGGGTHLQGNGGSTATGQAGGSAGATGTAGITTTGTGGSVAMTGTGGSGTMTGTGGSGTGTAGAGGAGVAVCSAYCTAIMKNCTGKAQQYADMANCMKICSYMPAGSPTDNGVDSVGCRTNAANAAMADPNKCWGAGPLSDGVCGNDCNTFCTVATSYCTAAGGFAGTPPYKSFDDCNSTCGQFQRVIDPAGPGEYNTMYTPGPDSATKDTLECRAYHLFINALASTANQAVHCPHAANMSAVCGPGVAAVDTDGGTTGGPIPTSDGGIVNVLNSTTWNETLYPPDKRKMLLRDEGDPHLVMIDLSKTPILQWKTVAGGPWARAAQLIGNNQIIGGRNDGYEVFDYTTGMITKTVNNFGNTQSAYRMASGVTMLTTSGTVLKFLDKTDKMVSQISYPGYGYVRVARPTRNGTFLVPSDTTVFEGDSKGNVIWKLTGGASGWGHIWEPLLMGPPVGGGTWNDGDTILCTAFGSSCDIIDKVKHTVTFRFGTKAMAMAATVRPNFFSEFEILPNGNLFCSNWQGHGAGNGGSGLQVLEFDPTGKLVWFWKQDPTIFSSIQGVQVMDGKDPKYLHVQETSPNSTWQPVNPTP